jgi:hypothetical protein
VGKPGNKKKIDAARERVLGSFIGITLQRQNNEKEKEEKLWVCSPIKTSVKPRDKTC